MYLILAAQGEGVERRRKRRHPVCRKPELLAESVGGGSGQRFSAKITRPPGIQSRTMFPSNLILLWAPNRVWSGE